MLAQALLGVEKIDCLDRLYGLHLAVVGWLACESTQLRRRNYEMKVDSDVLIYFHYEETKRKFSDSAR